MASSGSPITSVQQAPMQANIAPPLLTRLSLDLRGRRFNVVRISTLGYVTEILGGWESIWLQYCGG